MDGLTRSVVFGRARLARIYLLRIRRTLYEIDEKPRGAVHHITHARIHVRTYATEQEMAEYHKPESKIIQQLQNIAHKLRIHSVKATQASKSGWVGFLSLTVSGWRCNRGKSAVATVPLRVDNNGLCDFAALR